MTEEQIYLDFEQRGVALDKLEHPPVFTVEESAAIHEALPGAHTKNLFLKDKKGHHWLIVLPCDQRADLKLFAQVLGAGKFSFGKPEEMERLLGVAPGAVTPLAAANAPVEALTVVFDMSFSREERIAVHPLRNTATVAIAFEALNSWLVSKGVATKIIALSGPVAA